MSGWTLMSMNFLVYGTWISWMGWSPSSDRVILAVSECFAEEYLPLSAPSSFDPRTSAHPAPEKKTVWRLAWLSGWMYKSLFLATKSPRETAETCINGIKALGLEPKFSFPKSAPLSHCESSQLANLGSLQERFDLAQLLGFCHPSARQLGTWGRPGWWLEDLHLRG